ncbi:MAG: decaprenylphospho-beta-D-erythro-pentofuranosid-2-ulose 2-reductase [Actinomycetes bacterium]
MTDALARPTSLLILGGTSDIAVATVRALNSPVLRRVVLAARPSERRDAVVAALTGSGMRGVEVVDFDAADTATHQALLDSVFAQGDIDYVLLAFGVLGDQTDFEDNPDHAVEAATVNYVGAVSTALRVATLLKTQGHGGLVVFSSVAGERARKSNFVYGSTKAGLDSLANGLADSLHGTGVSVLIVRPGFVHTSMTSHLPAAPLSATAEQVAQGVVSGLRRGATVVYVPAALRVVMSGLRHVPRAVFRRLPI